MKERLGELFPTGLNTTPITVSKFDKTTSNPSLGNGTTRLSGAGATYTTSTDVTPYVNSMGISTGRVPLMLIGMASVAIDDTGWSSAGVIPAVEMALYDINRRNDILPGYELLWNIQDTQVSTAHL